MLCEKSGAGVAQILGVTGTPKCSFLAQRAFPSYTSKSNLDHVIAVKFFDHPSQCSLFTCAASLIAAITTLLS